MIFLKLFFNSYVVKLITIHIEKPQFYLVMELMEGGTLRSLLHSNAELPWDKRLSMLCDIAMGIQVLYNHKPYQVYIFIFSFLSSSFSFSFYICLCKGLKYAQHLFVHSAFFISFLDCLCLQVLHRDLNSANISLDKDNRCKLIDFGFAKLKLNFSKSSDAILGTLAWIAPELFKSKPNTAKSDMNPLK